jgi:hypothetical protein
MNHILAAVFNFFKTRSPKYYALFVAVVLAVMVADGQGFINVPQWIEDILITAGIITGVHTTATLKKSS